MEPFTHNSANFETVQSATQFIVHQQSFPNKMNTKKPIKHSLNQNVKTDANLNIKRKLNQSWLMK